MERVSEQQAFTYKSDWQAKRKLGRFKYGLIYGSIYGLIMILFKLLIIGDDIGYTSLTLGIVLEQWYWLVFGIVFSWTFLWWSNNRFYRIKKKNT